MQNIVLLLKRKLRSPFRRVDDKLLGRVINTTIFISSILLNLSFAYGQTWEHGALRVANNGRYLEHQDGTPFLWIGDTPWGLFTELNREGVDAYLDKRQQQGFTVIQSVIYWSQHQQGGVLAAGPPNPANAYGHRIFEGDSIHPDISHPRETPGSKNDYWDHVDYIVNGIKQRGMCLVAFPVWGRAYVDGRRGKPRLQTIFTEEAKSFGEFLGNRYKNEPHIIWCLVADTSPDYIPGAMDIYRWMAMGLAKGVSGSSYYPGYTDQGNRIWDKILLTFHDGADPTQWYQGEAWLDFNMYHIWGKPEDVYEGMYAGHQRNIPAVLGEGSYEGGAYFRECGWLDAFKARLQGYHTFFAGGCGYTYGHFGVWPMRGTDCEGRTWIEALNSPGAEDVGIHLRNLLEEHTWWTWIPDQSIIGFSQHINVSQVAVRTSDGDRILVYFQDSTAANISNKLSEEAKAQWFDPRNGEKVEADRFSNGQVMKMTPPSGWEDAVLILTKNI